MFQSINMTIKWLCHMQINGYLQYYILHANIVTTGSGSGDTFRRCITQRFQISRCEEAPCTKKRTENKRGSRTCVNVSEEAWAGRQMLYHIISNEISTVKIPSSRVYIFTHIP